MVMRFHASRRCVDPGPPAHLPPADGRRRGRRSCPGTVKGVADTAHKIRANGTSCPEARRVVRAQLAEPGEGVTYYRGFRCDDGGFDYLSCRKGSARITWRYR